MFSITYVQTCTHTYIHALAHNHIHTYTHTHIYTHKHIHTRSCAYRLARPQNSSPKFTATQPWGKPKQARSWSDNYQVSVCLCVYVCVFVYTERTHAQTHTYAHTHTHTRQSLPCAWIVLM